jgi:hypothetical protein
MCRPAACDSSQTESRLTDSTPRQSSNGMSMESCAVDDAGIVHQNVQPAQGFRRKGHDLCRGGLIHARKVRLHGGTLSPRSSILSRVFGLVAAIGQRDIGPRLGKGEAMPSPMPVAPPVTRALRSVRSNGLAIFSTGWQWAGLRPGRARSPRSRSRSRPPLPRSARRNSHPSPGSRFRARRPCRS